MKRELTKLTSLQAQEALNILIDYFLGEDWYVADPLGPTQVNAIAVDEILSKYSGPFFQIAKKIL